MAEQPLTDLKYGHFGQVLYDADEKAWLYARTLSTQHALQPLGPSQVIFKPQHDHSAHDAVTDEKPSTRLGKQLASLFTLQPTLAPAADFLPGPAIVSQEIQKTVARNDPTVGQLLAFGRIPDDATKRSLPIAAFPAANNPRTLRFVQVQPQKHGWDHNKSVWIDVPRIHGESGVWDASAPIRQLCFARAADDSALAQILAVRTTLGVFILRIAARRYLASWNTVHGAPSRLHPTQLCALTLDVCGGLPPAHVAFNHWYSKQFATVDQQGTWRVWDTNIKQNPSDHGKPVELCRGATGEEAIPDHVATASLLDDGWGRVTWAGNHHTLVSASRKCLGIHDIQGKPVRLHSPSLGISGTPHWILDLQTNPLDPSLVFVLTSVALFCLRIRPLDEGDPESYNTAGADTVLQCRHFRDSEDISLCLSSFVDDQDLVVLVKSSLGPLATSYRFSSDHNYSPSFLTVADPSLFTLPELPSTESGLSAILALDLQPAEFGESVHHEKTSGPGRTYRDLSLSFYVITAITSDLSVVQKICYASRDRNHLPEVLAPDWRGRLKLSHPRLPDAGFVEDNAAHKEMLSAGEEEPEAVNSAAGVKSVKSVRDNWTLLYELSHARAASAVSQTEDFSHILAKIQQVREVPEDAAAGHKLLYELRQEQVAVPDIDQATAEFNSLVVSNQQPEEGLQQNQATLMLLKIADNAALDIKTGHDMDPTTVYDSIISHWLTPLSQNVPGRVRLVKEQLARRIAAEICLASHVLRLPPLESTEEETPRVETQDSQYEGESSQPFFSQSSLPTPSPTATPSLTTVGSLSSHPSTLVSPEFARLQRYTTFASDKSTPAPLPRPLANTLAHWSLGGSPDQYDWLAVQRKQEKKAEEEDEDLTPKERARLKRRAERFLRKQRRETQKADSMNLANSQAPEIMSASQPAPVLATPSRRKSGAGFVPPSVPRAAATQGTPLIASSQSQLPQGMFASQVEPGRFGGKPAKKKRKVGF